MRGAVVDRRGPPAGAAARRHEDTDVVVLARDLTRPGGDGRLAPVGTRGAAAAAAGCSRPARLRAAVGAVRRAVAVADGVPHRPGEHRRGTGVQAGRVGAAPLDLAAHSVAGVGYLRPEVALLFKARQDRDKDRADLAAARLSDEGRAWLTRDPRPARLRRVGQPAAVAPSTRGALRDLPAGRPPDSPAGCGNGPPMTGPLPQPPAPRGRRRRW